MRKIYTINGTKWINYRINEVNILNKNINTLNEKLKNVTEEEKVIILEEISELKNKITVIETPTEEDLVIVQELFNSKMPVPEEDDIFSLCSAMCTLSETDGNTITITYMHNNIYNII